MICCNVTPAGEQVWMKPDYLFTSQKGFPAESIHCRALPKVCISFQTDCRVTKQQAYAWYQSELNPTVALQKPTANQEKKPSISFLCKLCGLCFAVRVVHSFLKLVCHMGSVHAGWCVSGVCWNIPTYRRWRQLITRKRWAKGSDVCDKGRRLTLRRASFCSDALLRLTSPVRGVSDGPPGDCRVSTLPHDCVAAETDWDHFMAQESLHVSRVSNVGLFFLAIF